MIIVRKTGKQKAVPLMLKRKVLIVDTSDRGGIALYTEHLFSELRRTGIDIALAAGGDRSVDARGFPRNRWADPGNHSSRLRFLLRRFREIPVSVFCFMRAMHVVRPDVVNVHTVVAHRVDPYVLRWAKRRAGLVLTVHNAVLHESDDAEVRREWARWRIADALVVHNEEAGRLVRAAAPSVPVFTVRVDLILGQTRLDKAAARQELGVGPAPLALMLGLIRPYKGIELMSEAWPLVLERRPEARLVIAGLVSKQPFDALDRLCGQPGVEPHLGWLSDDEVNLWAAAADVCLLPYSHGAHSGVLHRAVANGTPVVCAPCLADEAQRFAAGPVVELSPTLWADAVMRLLDNPGRTVPVVPEAGMLAQDMVEVYGSVPLRRRARKVALP